MKRRIVAFVISLAFLGVPGTATAIPPRVLAAARPCDDLLGNVICQKKPSVEVRGPTIRGSLYIQGARASLFRQQGLTAGCADCTWHVSYICNSQVGDGQETCQGGSTRCDWQLLHVELSVGQAPPEVIEEYCPPKPQPPVVALTPLTNTLLQRAAEQEKAVAPSVRYQPRGGAVTQLATYFAVDGASRAPVQFQVAVPQAPEVRMTVTATPRSWTWDFGDRSPSLSTTDPGGDYPDGKVTHTYRQRGEVTVTTTSTSSVSWTLVSPYGGLPGATLAQPATSPTTTTALRVREARAQLTH